MGIEGIGGFYESPGETDHYQALREAAERAESQRQREAAERLEVEREAERKRIEEEQKAEKERQERAERENRFRDIDDRYSREREKTETVIRDSLQAAKGLEGKRRSDELTKARQKIDHADGLRAGHEDALRKAAKETSEVEDRVKRIREQSETVQRMRQELEEQQREVRIEQDRAGRLADARPGFVGQYVDDLTQKLATRAIQFLAARAIDHVAPGAGAAVVHIFSIGKKLYDTVSQLEQADGITVDIPMVSAGIFELDFAVDIADEDPGNGSSLHLRPVADLEGPVSHRPQFAFHEMPPELSGTAPSSDAPKTGLTPLAPAEQSGTAEPARSRRLSNATQSFMKALDDIKTYRPEEPRIIKASVAVDGRGMFALKCADASEVSAESLAGTGPGEPVPLGGPYVPQPVPPVRQLAASRPAEAESRVAGVVICAPASLVASASGGVVESGRLLRLVRLALFRCFYDGDPRSVPAAMRAIRRLELVVFLDPRIDGGLWIDVDPVAEAPAATLLIEMETTPDGVGAVRFSRP